MSLGEKRARDDLKYLNERTEDGTESATVDHVGIAV